MNQMTLKDEVFHGHLKDRQNSTHNWFHDYADLFSDEVGSLPVTYHMNLDPNVPSVVCPPHRVPVAMIDKVKTELQNSGKSGIITPISEPTEWVSSMVATHKKGH